MTYRLVTTITMENGNWFSIFVCFVFFHLVTWFPFSWRVGIALSNCLGPEFEKNLAAVVRTTFTFTWNKEIANFVPFLGYHVDLIGTRWPRRKSWWCHPTNSYFSTCSLLSKVRRSFLCFVTSFSLLFLLHLLLLLLSNSKALPSLLNHHSYSTPTTHKPWPGLRTSLSALPVRQVLVSQPTHLPPGWLQLSLIKPVFPPGFLQASPTSLKLLWERKPLVSLAMVSKMFLSYWFSLSVLLLFLLLGSSNCSFLFFFPLF